MRTSGPAIPDMPPPHIDFHGCLLFVVEELGPECGDAVVGLIVSVALSLPPIKRLAQGGLQGFIVLQRDICMHAIKARAALAVNLHHASPHSPLSRSAAPAAGS